jgi:hypothetical protein
LEEILSPKLLARIDDYRRHQTRELPETVVQPPGVWANRKVRSELFGLAKKELEAQILSVKAELQRTTFDTTAGSQYQILKAQKTRLKAAVLRACDTMSDPSMVNYGSSAASAVRAEALMWILSLYIYGEIVSDGSAKGDYPGFSEYDSVPTAAKLMQGAALTQPIIGMFFTFSVMGFAVNFLVTRLSSTIFPRTR